MEKFMPLLVVIILGIIVLPETYSLFAGQHDWYDTTQNGIQIPCGKCHSDITRELSQPGTVNIIHNIMGCEECHVTTAPKSEDFKQGPGGQFHAAAVASCIDCHNTTLLYGTFDHSKIINKVGCQTCHSIPLASFSAVEIFTGEEEVHKDFANGAKNSSLLKDRNEACISCHTHVKVNIAWTKPVAMTMMATVNNNGSWSITNISSSGTTNYTTNG